MEYSLNAGEWNSVFAVPSSVVDKYIKLASGNALKLLLYLTRHGGETFTEQRLKEELGFEEFGELEDAALFWVQRGIIKANSVKDSTKLSAASTDTVSQKTVTETKSEPVKRTVQKAKPPTASSGEIAQSIKNSPEMQALFNAAENLFGRMLNQSDRETISNLTGYYGLPCDVALMLIGYCTNLKEKHEKKISASYISKTAQDWANDEITTAKLAEEKIRSLEKQDNTERLLCEKMGLNSNLSANYRAFIKRWVYEWGFGEDMIMLAYDKTVDQTGKWSPSYANKILENWKSDGITTPQAAEKSDAEYKKASGYKNDSSSTKKPVMTSAGKTSSFDTDSLFSRIMDNYKK